MRAPFGWTKAFSIQVKGHPLAESSKVFSKDSSKEKTSTALESESKIKSYWYIMTPDGDNGLNLKNLIFLIINNLKYLQSMNLQKKEVLMSHHHM